MAHFVEETFSGCNPICHDDNIGSGASEHADRVPPSMVVVSVAAAPALAPYVAWAPAPVQRHQQLRRAFIEDWLPPPLKADAWYQRHLTQELPPFPFQNAST